MASLKSGADWEAVRIAQEGHPVRPTRIDSSFHAADEGGVSDVLVVSAPRPSAVSLLLHDSHLGVFLESSSGQLCLPTLNVRPGDSDMATAKKAFEQQFGPGLRLPSQGVFRQQLGDAFESMSPISELRGLKVYGSKLPSLRYWRSSLGATFYFRRHLPSIAAKFPAWRVLRLSDVASQLNSQSPVRLAIESLTLLSSEPLCERGLVVPTTVCKQGPTELIPPQAEPVHFGNPARPAVGDVGDEPAFDIAAHTQLMADTSSAIGLDMTQPYGRSEQQPVTQLGNSIDSLTMVADPASVRHMDSREGITSETERDESRISEAGLPQEPANVRHMELAPRGCGLQAITRLYQSVKATWAISTSLNIYAAAVKAGNLPRMELWAIVDESPQYFVEGHSLCFDKEKQCWRLWTDTEPSISTGHEMNSMTKGVSHLSPVGIGAWLSNGKQVLDRTFIATLLSTNTVCPRQSLKPGGEGEEGLCHDTLVLDSSDSIFSHATAVLGRGRDALVLAYVTSKELTLPCCLDNELTPEALSSSTWFESDSTLGKLRLARLPELDGLCPMLYHSRPGFFREPTPPPRAQWTRAAEVLDALLVEGYESLAGCLSEALGLAGVDVASPLFANLSAPPHFLGHSDGSSQVLVTEEDRFQDATGRFHAVKLLICSGPRVYLWKRRDSGQLDAPGGSVDLADMDPLMRTPPVVGASQLARALRRELKEEVVLPEAVALRLDAELLVNQMGCQRVCTAPSSGEVYMMHVWAVEIEPEHTKLIKQTDGGVGCGASEGGEPSFYDKEQLLEDLRVAVPMYGKACEDAFRRHGECLEASDSPQVLMTQGTVEPDLPVDSQGRAGFVETLPTPTPSPAGA